MLNLLPWRHEQLILFREKIITFAVATIFFVLVSGVLIRLILNWQNKCVTATRIQLQEKMIVKQRLNESLVEQYKAKAERVNFCAVIKSQKNIIKTIENLAALIPHNCYLTLFSIDKNKLTIDGVLLSSRQELLKGFVASLEKSAHLLLKNEIVQLIQINKVYFKLIFLRAGEKEWLS